MEKNVTIDVDIEDKLIKKTLDNFVNTLRKESIEVYTKEIDGGTNVFESVGRAVLNNEVVNAIDILMDKNEH